MKLKLTGEEVCCTGSAARCLVFSLKNSAEEKYNENSLYWGEESRFMTGSPASGVGFPYDKQDLGGRG